MNVLGRGLASLIPQRESDNAEDIIEKIDSMQTTEEEPEHVRALREDMIEGEGKVEDQEKVEPRFTKLSVVEEEESNVEESKEAKELKTYKKKDRKNIKKVKEEEVVEKIEVKEKPKIKKIKKKVKVAETALGERVEQVPVGDIKVNSQQPRHRFDEEELDELVQSLDQHGLLQPLVIIKSIDGPGYELIAGERRLRAVKKLGWDTVPCVLRGDVNTERHRLELALVENIQRQNLNPVEEAMGYQRLNEEYGLTHEEVGMRVGRSRVGITNIIRLLQLPAEVQRGLIDGKITTGHARAILMIPDEEKQTRFYHHLVEEGLTVRKAENRARRIQRTMKLNDPLRKKTRGRHALALKYDGVLEERYGFNSRLRFNSTKNRFEVVFHAFSEEEAEELVARLMGTKELPKDVDADVIDI